jgi:hypothetical protein
MQKKFLIISFVVLLAVVLSACGNTNTAAATESVVEETTAASDSSLDEVAAASLQLALGVTNLRNTDYQIDATQAATLITLFQNYQTLLSGTYDASQVQSALDGIKAALTADQLQAIDDMGALTLDDLTMGRGGRADGTPDATMIEGTPDPSMMQGGGPGGDGGGPGGGPQGGSGGQAPEGTPGAGGPGGGQGPDAMGTPGAGDGSSMQTIIESIASSSVTPGLNPDLMGLVVTNLQMIK